MPPYRQRTGNVGAFSHLGAFVPRVTVTVKVSVDIRFALLLQSCRATRHRCCGACSTHGCARSGEPGAGATIREPTHWYLRVTVENISRHGTVEQLPYDTLQLDEPVSVYVVSA